MFFRNPGLWAEPFSLGNRVCISSFGLGIELAQSLTGYRFGDPIDLAANTLGIIVVGVFFHNQRNKL